MFINFENKWNQTQKLIKSFLMQTDERLTTEQN